MKLKQIAGKIIELKEEDLALRKKLIQTKELSEGYHKEMAKLHNRNAELLNQIIDSIGYPTVDKVGKEASEAAWLIIQHSIGQPTFMKKCLFLLKEAVEEKKASPINLAYLSDRIAVFEGKPQRYGTQFDWNENGELCPQAFDERSKVNKRRKAVGLNSLEEQIEFMKERAKNENQTPPLDYEKSRMVYDDWRKTVGWIK